ncbi:hypothetical protein FIBSPDRAFT_1037342 [Athelia psychrophila]|uniref:DUF6533 domain-containing protein n=1 Tax=Athelia psychrophila TaxID=1759441 RepID=A0A166UKS3_9AGAM|nr:hypothetical protein FIBSPDRAFT_1037342 [Fibularhizoctonia sp. CBS 109695]
MNSSTMLPNPYTPMAFLEPYDAEGHMLSAYVYSATTGALVWDWLMSIPDEYKMLSRGGISRSKVVYVCSRVFSLAFCLCSTIFQSAPVSNCQSLLSAIAVLTILALNTNTFLFFIRVRAVYGNSRRVTTFFSFCYVVVFGTSLYVPFALHARSISSESYRTDYCEEWRVNPWIAAAMLSNVINNTLVFFAISYRIASTSSEGWRSMLRSFFLGDGVPRVAKQLLHNGQLCYFATIALSITQIIMALTSTFYTTATIPVMALENAMTCRVHRGIILGLIGNSEHQTTTTFALSTVAWRTAERDDTAPKELGPDPSNPV